LSQLCRFGGEGAYRIALGNIDQTARDVITLCRQARGGGIEDLLTDIADEQSSSDSQPLFAYASAGASANRDVLS